MAGRHQRCNGHELWQTSGDGEEHIRLVCCSPWDCKESDTTGQLNHNSNKPMMTQVHISWLRVFMCYYDINMQTETKEFSISNITCALQYVF